jgi:hypothetical protein
VEEKSNQKKAYGLVTFFDKNIFNPKIYSGQETVISAWNATYFSSSTSGMIHQTSSKQTTRPWLDLITNFMGLPFFGHNENEILGQNLDANRDKPILTENEYDDISPTAHLRNAAKKISGWDKESYWIINIIRAFLYTVVKLAILFPLRLLGNIARLFTEFVPLLIKRATGNWINRLLDVVSNRRAEGGQPDHNIFARMGAFALIILLLPIHFAAKLVHLVGRALTSPGQSIQAALQAGRELGGDGPLGTIIGGAFALVSIALTTAMFVIAWPAAIKLLATYVPGFFTTAIQPALNFLNTILSPITSFLGPVVTPIFNALGGFFAGISSSAAVGLGAIAGVVAGPFAVITDKLSAPNWFKDFKKGLGDMLRGAAEWILKDEGSKEDIGKGEIYTVENEEDSGRDYVVFPKQSSTPHDDKHTNHETYHENITNPYPTVLDHKNAKQQNQDQSTTNKQPAPDNTTLTPSLGGKNSNGQ